MAKILSIKENHLFSKAYAKGKKATGKNVAVYVLRNFRSTETRLGITTGKKLGNSPQRSRARRLIREAYRLTVQNQNWKYPCLVVIVARNAITEKGRKSWEVQAELKRIFAQLSLFSEESN